MPLFIIIYNPHGVAFAALAGLVGALAAAVAPAALPKWLPLVMGCLAGVAVDAGFRLKRLAEQGVGCLFYPRSGGHLWFIPIWAFCLMILVAGLNDQGRDARPRTARPRPAVSAAATSPAPR